MTPQIQLHLAQERRMREIEEAARERLLHPRPSFRRSLGHSIIRIGERLAEESQLQAVRSR